MESYYWQNWATGNPFPTNAVHGGIDADGPAIYIGRANYNGDLLPVKIIPAKDAAYIAYGGEEISIPECEVMCTLTLRWEPASNGSVPEDAVPVGSTADGERLYIGRVNHEGSHTIGKVQPSHGTCYIPFDGKEVSNCNYEVLVLSKN